MSKIDSPSVPCKGDYLPQYAHKGDAGADLRAAEPKIIAPRSRELIATGISLELPDGYVGLIWPRSGLAVKRGLDCGAGVIDSHYRGEIKVLLFNHSDTEIQIQSGDRIAQLIIQKVEKPLIKQILLRTGGNQVHAARILGINRNTLRKKIKIYSL